MVKPRLCKEKQIRHGKCFLSYVEYRFKYTYTAWLEKVDCAEKAPKDVRGTCKGNGGGGDSICFLSYRHGMEAKGTEGRKGV